MQGKADTRPLLEEERKLSPLRDEQDVLFKEFFRCLGYGDLPVSEIKYHLAELDKRGIGFEPVMNEMSRE